VEKFRVITLLAFSVLFFLNKEIIIWTIIAFGMHGMYVSEEY
jgi:hypothetical protein